MPAGCDARKPTVRCYPPTLCGPSHPRYHEAVAQAARYRPSPQGIRESLFDDVMVRQLDRGRAIFEARIALGENRGDQLLCAQPLDPGGDFTALRRAHDRERAGGDVAEAHLEHRRIEQRLRRASRERCAS